LAQIPFVIASEAKQSSGQIKKSLDCFVAMLLAMTGIKCKLRIVVFVAITVAIHSKLSYNRTIIKKTTEHNGIMYKPNYTITDELLSAIAEIEVKNYKEALDYIEKRTQTKKPITLSDILTVHRTIMARLLPAEEIGSLRRRDIYIADQDDNILYTGP
jgi:hypothetical protein